jgi:hypothetical protein
LDQIVEGATGFNAGTPMPVRVYEVQAKPA